MKDDGITISRRVLRRIGLGLAGFILLGSGYGIGRITSSVNSGHVRLAVTPREITSSTTEAGTATTPSMSATTQPTTTTTTVPHQQVPAVEICGVGAPVIRPVSMTLACADGNTQAKNLDWTSWGNTAAKATGIDTWNTCVPYCAASNTWDSTEATFTLTNPVSTSKGLLFESLIVQDTGPTPPGVMRTVTYSEAPTTS